MVPDVGILDGLSVLVIEDNADCRLLTELTLSKAGAHVDEARDGPEGYEKAKRGAYSLVLIDLQMPGMDGNTVTKRLRKEGYRKPLVALTASAMKEDCEVGLAAGHDGYLVKPVTARDLVEAVIRYAKGVTTPCATRSRREPQGSDATTT
jgi:CheY-like chemotaxis protein